MSGSKERGSKVSHEEMKRRLLNVGVDSIIQKIIPTARAKGRYLVCGDIEGSEGKSFRICRDTGVWKDFADEKGGDIIELFKRKYGSEGYNEIRGIIGIEVSAKQSSYTPPRKDWTKLNQACFEYLNVNRGLKEDIIKRSMVQSKSGTVLVFPHFEGDSKRPCLMTYKPITGGDCWCSKDSKQVLYGTRWINKKFPSSPEKTLVITEGHIDCLTWMQYGYRAVSMPMGCNNLAWIEHNWELLSTFEIIYLAMDDDAPGEQAAVKISSRLGAYRCRRIKYFGHKDSNEALMSGDFEPEAMLAMCEEYKPVKACRASTLVETIKMKWGQDRTKAGVFLFDDPRMILRLRPGEPTVVTGEQGSGKSLFLYQLVGWLMGKQDKKCAIFSLEEDGDVVAKLIYGTIMANVPENDPVMFDQVVQRVDKNFYIYPHRGKLDADIIFSASEFFVRRHGCEFIIIDSLMMTNLDRDDNNALGNFIAKICEHASTTGAHFILVAHPRKGDYSSLGKMPEGGDISGSSAVQDMVFNGITIWRNKKKEMILSSKKGFTDVGSVELVEKVTRQSDGMLIVWKQKVSGVIGECRLYHDKLANRFSSDRYARHEPYIEVDYNEYENEDEEDNQLD